MKAPCLNRTAVIRMFYFWTGFSRQQVASGRCNDFVCHLIWDRMCDKLKKVIDLNLGISEFLNDRNPFKLFLQGVNFTFHLFQRFKLFVVLQVNGLLLQGFNRLKPCKSKPLTWSTTKSLKRWNKWKVKLTPCRKSLKGFRSFRNSEIPRLRSMTFFSLSHIRSQIRWQTKSLHLPEATCWREKPVQK